MRLTVAGRTVEAIDTFIERLEATTASRNVQPSSEIVTRGRPVRDAVTGRYLTARRPAATPTAPAGPAAPASPGRQGAR